MADNQIHWCSPDCDCGYPHGCVCGTCDDKRGGVLTDEDLQQMLDDEQAVAADELETTRQRNWSRRTALALTELQARRERDKAKTRHPSGKALGITDRMTTKQMMRVQAAQLRNKDEALHALRKQYQDVLTAAGIGFSSDPVTKARKLREQADLGAEFYDD